MPAWMNRSGIGLAEAGRVGAGAHVGVEDDHRRVLRAEFQQGVGECGPRFDHLAQFHGIGILRCGLLDFRQGLPPFFLVRSAAVPLVLPLHEGDALAFDGVGDHHDRSRGARLPGLFDRVDERRPTSCPSHSKTCQPKALHLSASGSRSSVSGTVPLS